MCLLGIALIAFWIWMLVDCIQRDFKDKVLWILIILLTQTLGAIIYYFVVKRNDSLGSQRRRPAHKKFPKRRKPRR